MLILYGEMLTSLNKLTVRRFGLQTEQDKHSKIHTNFSMKQQICCCYSRSEPISNFIFEAVWDNQDNFVNKINIWMHRQTAY